MAKNPVAQVGKAGGGFELVEREMPQPGGGEVRIKVQPCGICFSDHLVKDGAWPGLAYPRVPGHEVAGVIDEVEAGVTEWKKGDRVGVGWHGGHCFVCERCRRGDFVTCQRQAITGLTRDGGYQQYMIARHEAVALIPEGLDAANAGPLLCARITTYNSLRHIAAKRGRPGGSAGNWRIGTFVDSVRCKIRIPRGGHRARPGERSADEEIGGVRVHR